MAWCETVEFGKGPCKGCSDKSTILENSGLEIQDKQSSINTMDDNQKSVDGVKDCDNENDTSYESDDENAISDDCFSNLQEQSILDISYDEPKSQLNVASIISFYKLSTTTFGWRSGGVSVKYKSSERGGLINKQGKSRFFLDRVGEDGSIMVRHVIILI